MNALKRIEERYTDTEQGVTLFVEGHYSPRPASGAELDVRKLARALAEAERQLRILAKRLLPVVTATNEEIRQVIAHADDAQRTLEEVAGD